MNMVGPPQGGFSSDPGAAPPTPVAVQQTTVIQMGSQKSVVGAVLLALFFGPLGMLYATVPGALIMFAISFPILILTLGFGLLITLPICAIWAGIAANSHNTRLQGVMGHQSTVSAQATVAAAGWHNDPAGSGRLRYYDGTRWTDHYAEQAQKEPASPAEQPPAQLASPAKEVGFTASDSETEVVEAEGDESEAPTAVADAEAQHAFCGSCGNKVLATARFCSACGETQATT
jgi:uncharacterized protein DUF2510/zinc ribbon protein